MPFAAPPVPSSLIVPSSAPSLFRSFWMGGFESATHINRDGIRQDMIAGTQHDVQAMRDYALLRESGMRTARDGVRWNLIDRGGRYDFAPLEPLATAARERGVQTIWSLCHYGWPDDLDLFSPAFPDRFARYCGAVARYFAARSDDVPWYTPVNEISFLAWAGGDVAYLNPFAHGRGGEIKRQLVRASIAGMEAIWDVDRRARFALIDPLIHIVAPRNRPDLAAEARAVWRGALFETWDMLAGRAFPELGGDAKYLDVVGVNFYHDNQWEHDGDRISYWDEPRDRRYMPLSKLLAEVWRRYRRPLFIAETSHYGPEQPRWIRDVTQEVILALRGGVPVEGICLYPFIDRYDWQDTNHWHHSGLFDSAFEPDGTQRRVLDAEYGAELRRCQEAVAEELTRLRTRRPPPMRGLTRRTP